MHKIPNMAKPWLHFLIKNRTYKNWDQSKNPPLQNTDAYFHNQNQNQRNLIKQ